MKFNSDRMFQWMEKLFMYNSTRNNAKSNGNYYLSKFILKLKFKLMFMFLSNPFLMSKRNALVQGRSS